MLKRHNRPRKKINGKALLKRHLPGVALLYFFVFWTSGAAPAMVDKDARDAFDSDGAILYVIGFPLMIYGFVITAKLGFRYYMQPSSF